MPVDHSSAPSCWIATRTPSAVRYADRAGEVSWISATDPVTATRPLNGATHRRSVSTSGKLSICCCRNASRSSTMPVGSTVPAPIGSGVSAEFAVNVGTPPARWLNSTWPPSTRSVRPSPLTSLKYVSLEVNVSEWLAKTFATKYASPPKENMSELSWESAGRPGAAWDAPAKSVLPSGPDVLSRKNTPDPLRNTLSGRLSPLRSTMASTPSLPLWLNPTLAPPENCLVGSVGLNPTYMCPPMVVPRFPDSALAWPWPSSPASTLSDPVSHVDGEPKPL